MVVNSMRETEIDLELLFTQLASITRKLHRVERLDAALEMVVQEIRAFLASDRVLIYRFLPQGDGVVAAESVQEDCPPIQGQLLYDPCFETKWNVLYQQGQVSQIEDLDTLQVAACYRELLTQLQVRANLVVPILLGPEVPTADASLPLLWGLLIAHECHTPRQWQPLEVQMLQQVALQVSLVIQSQTSGADGANAEASSWRSFDQLRTPVWIFDIDQLRMHWANQASLYLWDTDSREELLNRDFSDASESTRIRLQFYRQQFQQGKTLVEQWTFYPGGHPVTVQCRCSGILIDSGRWAMLVEANGEGMERLDQETLRSIEALRHTTVMIALYTLDGTPLMQNPAAMRCYGNLLQPQMTADADNIFLRHFVDPDVGRHAIAVAESGAVFSIEAQVATLNGLRWHGIDVRQTRDPVTGDAMLLVNEKDTTVQHAALRDRQRVEAQLEAQRAFLRQIIDTVPSSIFVKDRQGRLLVVNQATTEIHGTSVEAMLGKLEPEFNGNFNLQQLDEFLSTNWDVMTTRQPQKKIQQIITASGELRWHQTTIRPFLDPQGEVQGIIGNSVDITELKQAEAELQQKSQRLATIITVQQDIALNNPNLDEVMGLIVEHAQYLTHASGAVIELVEADELVYRAGSGIARASIGLRLKIANSLSGQCVTTGKLLQCEDVETDLRVDQDACRRVGVRAMVVVPLLSAGDCIGVLKIFSDQAHAFSEQDVQTLQLMAGFLAAAIKLAAEFDAKNALLAALQESEERYRSVVTVLAEGIVLQQANGQIIACNESAEKILGLTTEQMMGCTSTDSLWQAIQADGSPFPGERHPAMVTLRTGRPLLNVVMGICKPDGRLTWISINSQPLFQPDHLQPYAVVTSFSDITLYKQAEAALKYQAERERMIHAIAQHIRQSLDLDNILTTTVTEVRNFLQCDRVIIYRFNPDWSGVVVTESVAPEWISILNWEITDTYFVERQGRTYQDKEIRITSNIYTAGLSQCHVELLEKLQVQAKLVVPIWQSGTLWGLMVAHNCSAPREWHGVESALLMQLSTQLAIAIQQSELYQQVQSLNTGLELQVQERTAQLQQSLEFEALLKRITDNVRDSLDEQKILQAVVRELVRGLNLKGCDTGIYNAEQTTSTIACELMDELLSSQGQTFLIADAPHVEVYPYLLQGQICQFCDVMPNPLRSTQHLLTVLACPIFDDQGVLGDLWLFKQSGDGFNEQEVRLVQQVVNQCAIALRQSRLYHAAQTQVEELERLNRLKDDFLSTVSHELRTPMSGIKAATQMLEISLQSLGVFDDQQTVNPIRSYLQVLQTECDREINLIDDLLDLTRLSSGTEPLQIAPVYLQFWLPHIAEPFIDLAEHHQQRLEVLIPENLPAIATDVFYLERAFTELLHNACKYTPAGQTIMITATWTDPTQVVVRVSNSGVEIPFSERDRIFEKFYRIPNNDPWKYGGTGLGLALVNKLVDWLQGTIHVESQNNWTTFCVTLPLMLESQPQ